MKIEVGMKCKQTKVIEKFGFDFVGKEFTISQVKDDVIMGLGSGVGFGIEASEFANYFELIQETKEAEEVEKSTPKVYIYEVFPYMVNWKITDKDNNVSYEATNGEGFSFKLIINGSVTVVIFDDGNKGVAKCMPTDTYDVDKGIEIAYTKALIKSYEKKLRNLIK